MKPALPVDHLLSPLDPTLNRSHSLKVILTLMPSLAGCPIIAPGEWQ